MGKNKDPIICPNMHARARSSAYVCVKGRLYHVAANNGIISFSGRNGKFF